MSKKIQRCQFGVLFKNNPLQIAELSDDFEERADNHRELRKKWHVVMLLMSPPLYRPQREPDPPEFFEQGPTFHTEKEAEDWIKYNNERKRRS